MSTIVPLNGLVGTPNAQVVFFPGAMGSASDFRQWRGRFGTDVHLYSVELPGRGSRLDEPPTDDLGAVSTAIVNRIMALPSKPVILIGYSMGALLATYVSQQLEVLCGKTLALLVICSGLPMGTKYPVREEISYEEFLTIPNLPEEIRCDEEFSRIYYEVLKHDIHLTRNLIHVERLRLSCPISVYGGDADARIPVSALEEWRLISSGRISINSVAGGHDFLLQLPAAADRIAIDIEETLQASGLLPVGWIGKGGRI